MSKTVNISDYRIGYKKAIQEIVEELEAYENSLFDRSIELLLTGKWEKWSDDQPIGTIFNFREKEMLEADDTVVNALLELKNFIKEKRELITNRKLSN